MNTPCACAVIGLGCSLAFAAGCSISNSGATDARRDVGGNRDTRSGTNTYTNSSTSTSTGATCTYNGVTYQQGESFTNNCVRYTCVSGDNFTASGSPCSDASTTAADTRVNRDSAQPADAPADAPPGRDTNDVATSGPEVGASEAGSPEVEVNLDTYSPDLIELEDLPPPPADTAPPGVDAGTEPDTAAPVQCTYEGQKYGVGVPFACGCNTCECDDTGTVVVTVPGTCDVVDGG